MFDDLVNKTFREAFVDENIRMRLALQIRALREKREWSQEALAERAGKTQSVISRLEDPSYGRFTIRTLLDLASAFDVALLVTFASHEKLINEMADVSFPALAVESYSEGAKRRAEAAATVVPKQSERSPISTAPSESWLAAVVQGKGNIAQDDKQSDWVAPYYVKEISRSSGEGARAGLHSATMPRTQQLLEFRP